MRGSLGGDPTSGHLYAFCNRRRDRIKVLYFDAGGLWACAKRLEKGTFWWPDSKDTHAVELTREELVALLGGLDLDRTRRRRWYRMRNEEKTAHAR